MARLPRCSGALPAVLLAASMLLFCRLALAAAHTFVPVAPRETGDIGLNLRDDDVDVDSGAGARGPIVLKKDDEVTWTYYYEKGGPGYEVKSGDSADIDTLSLAGAVKAGTSADLELKLLDCDGNPLGVFYTFTFTYGADGDASSGVFSQNDFLGSLQGKCIGGFILKVKITAGQLDFTSAKFFWEAGDIAPGPETFKVVPVIVNVLQGVTQDRAEMAGMIQGANRILKQAKVRLDFDRDRDFHTGVHDGGNNDGKVRAPEACRLRDRAAVELKNRFGKSRGYKIYVAKELYLDNPLAITRHNGGVLRVTFIRPTTDLPAATKAAVMAHEAGHAFTLGARHLIDDKSDNDPSNDLRATGESHHPTDTKNLMHEGIALHGGTQLTRNQIEEICDKARENAVAKAITDTDCERRDEQLACWTDPDDDVGVPGIDLETGCASLGAPANTLHLSLQTLGLNSPAASHDVGFEWLFDADNNPGTGIGSGPFSGIDRIVRVRLSGSFPFGSPSGSAAAELQDITGGSTLPLGNTTIQEVHDIADFAPPQPGTSASIGVLVDQPVPLSLLGLVPGAVPIGVRAIDLPSGEVDTASFIFDPTPVPVPDVHVSPRRTRSGDSVDVTGHGFAPGSPLAILVDDSQVASGTTAADGSFATSFAAPAAPTGDYFVTVRDAAGLSDFCVYSNTDAAPLCRIVAIRGGPPVQLDVLAHDPDSGLAAIHVITAINASVSIPAFVAGERGPIIVTATKINQSQRAVIELDVEDVAGNHMRCDPLVAHLEIPPLRNTVAKRFGGLPAAESWITVQNGRPGLRKIRVQFNARPPRDIALVPAQLASANFRSDVRAGKNTLRVRAWGPPGSEALLTVADGRYVPALVPAERAAGRTRRRPDLNWGRGG